MASGAADRVKRNEVPPCAIPISQTARGGKSLAPIRSSNPTISLENCSGVKSGSEATMFHSRVGSRVSPARRESREAVLSSLARRYERLTHSGATAEASDRNHGMPQPRAAPQRRRISRRSRARRGRRPATHWSARTRNRRASGWRISGTTA
jgi:hypothetical protein